MRFTIRSARWFALLGVWVLVACGGSTQPQATTPRSTTPSVVRSAPPNATATVAESDSPSSPPAQTTAATGDSSGPTGATERARVVSVTDGDTIRVRIDGVEYRLRYIGIDAPERGDDPLARQATRANERLVEGAKVFLEKDVSETDRYDRLLRHVWLKAGGSWTLVSAELVRLGLAYAKSYAPDTMYDAELAAAQSEAEDGGVGLWSESLGLLEPPAGPTMQPDPTNPPRTPRPPVPQGNCEPSYPDVCIPPSPPDLDCDDVSYDDFRVVGSDPHRFDGDNDGWGCES